VFESGRQPRDEFEELDEIREVAELT